MRVALARVLLGMPGVLLMDEPTNHLKDFEGTMIFVSELGKNETQLFLLGAQKHKDRKALGESRHLQH